MTNDEARNIRPDKRTSERPDVLRGTALHETWEQQTAWMDWAENSLADMRQRGEVLS